MEPMPRTATPTAKPTPKITTKALSRRLTLGGALVLCLLITLSSHATNSWVVALSGNGILSWTNPPNVNYYTITWALTVNGPWSSN